MMSSIGSCRTLESLGIPVLKDIPGVGQAFCDQAGYGTSFRVNVPTNSVGLNNPTSAAAAAQIYINGASSPLSVVDSGELGFKRLPPRFAAVCRLPHKKPSTKHFRPLLFVLVTVRPERFGPSTSRLERRIVILVGRLCSAQLLTLRQLSTELKTIGSKTRIVHGILSCHIKSLFKVQSECCIP